MLDQDLRPISAKQWLRMRRGDRSNVIEAQPPRRQRAGIFFTTHAGSVGAAEPVSDLVTEQYKADSPMEPIKPENNLDYMTFEA